MLHSLVESYFEIDGSNLRGG